MSDGDHDDLRDEPEPMLHIPTSSATGVVASPNFFSRTRRSRLFGSRQSRKNNVVELRGGGAARAHHAEKHCSLPLIEGAPQIDEGKFVRVINELRDAWLAARGRAGGP